MGMRTRGVSGLGHERVEKGEQGRGGHWVGGGGIRDVIVGRQFFMGRVKGFRPGRDGGGRRMAHFVYTLHASIDPFAFVTYCGLSGSVRRRRGRREVLKDGGSADCVVLGERPPRRHEESIKPCEMRR